MTDNPAASVHLGDGLHVSPLGFGGMALTPVYGDVDPAEALEARYGSRVPVLAHGDIELCHYFLDRSAVTAYLAAFR